MARATLPGNNGAKVHISFNAAKRKTEKNGMTHITKLQTTEKTD